MVLIKLSHSSLPKFYISKFRVLSKKKKCDQRWHHICNLLKTLPTYSFALISEENLKSPAETESGEALSLLLGSHEASSPDVQFRKTEREGSSSTEMEGSVIHYLLHEDEQDFKVSITRVAQS